MELAEILTKLKDTNDLIDPNETVRLIEAVGMLIDELDLAIIDLEGQVNLLWHGYQKDEEKRTNAEITNLVKIDPVYIEFKTKGALLKSLRRHYRLLNTKLNLLIKPRGR